MKKGVTPNSEIFVSKNAHLIGASPLDRLGHGKTLDEEKLSRFLADIQTKIHEGFADDAEERCLEILENYNNSIEAQAQLNQLLSVALEKQGFFADALKALQPFEKDEVIATLSDETRALVLAQLGICYSIAGDTPKAVLLLGVALKIAEERDLIFLLSSVNLALARVYQENNEFTASKTYAEKALKFARDLGDRRGLAEAYRVNANNFHLDGNHLKALELFQQALKLIGERPAPSLSAKIFSDMSPAYSGAFRPQDSFDGLKKAIEIFEKTGQKFELIIANYHFGNSLLQSGDWKKAEEVLNRTFDSAAEINHPQIPLILASLGEIAFLRGDNEEAEKILIRALGFALENKKLRLRIPVLYNLARCLLAQDKFDETILRANEAVENCRKTKENNILRLSNLLLAEAYLKKRKTSRAEEVLQKVETDESAQSYLALGNAARIRALMALAVKDNELALHHYSRSLLIFEKANDYYNSALIHYEIGKNLIETHPGKAVKNLESASQIFRQLAATERAKSADEILGKLNKKEILQKSEVVINSQLLMLRLVEAVSSRQLLIAELVKILREEGKAKKLLVAEPRERRLHATTIEGFSVAENVELITKLQFAQSQDELEEFAKEKNFGLFHLRSPNAPPILLILYPSAAGNLKDGSSIQPLLQVVELGIEVCALREINKDRPTNLNFNPIQSNSLMPGFIHSSPGMTALVEEIQKIGDSDVNVLITGESGTGKELIARAVHYVSQRKNKVFVPFNCTAVPRELTEGHLFGYKKGAFTGATQDSEGVIRSANGGTLFLDEIGDLGLDVQPKLLRFLQEGEVQPLGENAPKKVDVRIVAATNMHVEEMVMKGLFREDLYYRLNVIRLKIPPLRERRSEIPQLVDYYIKHYSARFGRRDLSISSEAMDLLIAYNWKGNVRQLCNEVQRMVARANSGDTINPQHLSPEIKPNEDSISSITPNNFRATGLTSGAINIKTEGASLEEAVTALEVQMISESLKRHHQVIARVAKELNITRRGLYLKMERYNLK